MQSGQPELGRVLGERYRLLQALGSGGMGVVYEAENVLTAKRVALKWIPAADRPGARDRLLREAQAASRIRHRHVVDVYDVGLDNDALFLVMQLLSGETLGDLLATRTIAVPELIRLLSEAMRGASAAHSCNVIHRDIKPDNIFLAREPDQSSASAILLDFGIARVEGADALTRSGRVSGTPLFMPLEQLRGLSLDARTDVYAFGVSAYLALSGKYPHFGRSLADLVLQVASAEPIPLQVLRPDLPRSLCEIISGALRREPAQRAQSLDELIAALEPLATEAGFLAQSAKLEHTVCRERVRLAAHSPLAGAASRFDTTPSGPCTRQLVDSGELAPAPQLLTEAASERAFATLPPPRGAWRRLGHALVLTLLGAVLVSRAHPPGDEPDQQLRSPDTLQVAAASGAAAAEVSVAPPPSITRALAHPPTLALERVPGPQCRVPVQRAEASAKLEVREVDRSTRPRKVSAVVERAAVHPNDRSAARSPQVPPSTVQDSAPSVAPTHDSPPPTRPLRLEDYLDEGP